MEKTSYKQWLDNNHEDITYEYSETIIEFPEDIYEGVLDDDYQEAEEKYIEDLTIKDVPKEFIKKEWERHKLRYTLDFEFTEKIDSYIYENKDDFMNWLIERIYSEFSGVEMLMRDILSNDMANLYLKVMKSNYRDEVISTYLAERYNDFEGYKI